MGQIPEGFILQVVSGNTGGPQADEIEAALRRAGFTDSQSISYRSPGNWKIKETKEIRIDRNYMYVRFTAGSKDVYIKYSNSANEIKKSVGAKIKNVNGHTMIPLRLLSGAFGYYVDWNAEKRIVTIGQQ